MDSPPSPPETRIKRLRLSSLGRLVYQHRPAPSLAVAISKGGPNAGLGGVAAALAVRPSKRPLAAEADCPYSIS